MATTEAPPFRFLELPGELRNQIYRDALVTSDPITITSSGYIRNGLLQTCKQVHAETFRLHQTENTFHFNIINFDIKPALNFLEKWDAEKVSGMRLCERDVPKFVITCEYVPLSLGEGQLEEEQREEEEYTSIWQNLLHWLQTMHSSKNNLLLYNFSPNYGKGPQGLLLRKIIDAMFTRAVETREEKDWEYLEREFENQRSSIERADRSFEGSFMGFSEEVDMEVEE